MIDYATHGTPESQCQKYIRIAIYISMRVCVYIYIFFFSRFLFIARKEKKKTSKRNITDGLDTNNISP